jgi:hypothetical protein
MTANAMKDARGEGGMEPSTFELDVYWASGRTGDAALGAHVEACDRCRGYLADLDAARPAVVPLALRGQRPRPISRRPWALPTAFAGALALAAGFLLLARERPPQGDSYVGVKGTPAVELLVHRDSETRIWDGRTPVRPGDALALRVACEGLKRVVVAAPGKGGEWARLSAVGCPERGEPLPFTLKVDGEPGDESLAVVLSQDELDPRALEHAIEQSRREGDVWVVRFELPKEIQP